MKIKNITKKITAVFAALTMMVTAFAVSASAAGKAFLIKGDYFREVYSVTGEKTIDYVTFKQVINYELNFKFKLQNGKTKTYTAFSTNLKDTVAFIPMQDMLNKLKITPEDIVRITVSGPSIDNVKKMSFTLER